MLCCALVCGGLAASQVRERERRAEAAVGPMVSVVVAERDLPDDRRLRAGDLSVRRVPARFAPPDGLAERVLGARMAVPVAAGSYLTSGLLQGAGSDAGSGVARGQRAVELAVTGGSALADAGPGSRVDVVVSTQADAGGRTFVALEDIELVDLRAGGAAGFAGEGGDGGGGVPSALATLRVTVRQAVYLAAAANFAQEVRLLVRPPGDHTRVGPAAVGAGGL